MSRKQRSTDRDRVVVVPPLTGLDVPAAHDTALDGGMLAVEDGSSPAGTGRRVVRQSPEPGLVVPYGSVVSVRTEPPPGGNDGGGGPGGGGVAPVGPGPVRSGRA